MTTDKIDKKDKKDKRENEREIEAVKNADDAAVGNSAALPETDADASVKESTDEVDTTKNTSPELEDKSSAPLVDSGAAISDAAMNVETQHDIEENAPSQLEKESETESGREPLNETEAQPADANASREEVKQTKTRRKKVKTSQTDNTVRPWSAVLVSFLFIAVCLIVAGGLYGFWYGKTLIDGQRNEIAELQQQLTAAQISVNEKLQQARSQLQAEQNATQQQFQAADKSINDVLNDLDQRMIAQNKRLRSMSTTSREDWLLAEAEYLLKLANQRVLIEKNAEGAAALLTEADAILRDLGDPDLFAIRREVKKDLAALRLTEKIDVEGIYLSLVALAEQVENLPVNPTMQQQIEAMRPSNDDRIKELSNLDDQPWYKRFGEGVADFGEKLKDFFDVHHFEAKPTPMLPPNEASYLQQNLRMMIERAQLALLREQQDVYRQSLEQTKAWIEKYFPQSKKTQSFIAQIDSIEQENIVRNLPDITASLELLQGYIIDLHRVGDAKDDSRGQQ